MIDLFFGLSLMVTLTWPWSGTLIVAARVIRGEAPRTWWVIYYELRPFYLPAAAVLQITWALSDNPGPLWARLLVLAVNLWTWRTQKDMGDDDRWKRRLEKLAAKVAVQGHRLAVVPAEGGAS